MNSMAHVIIFIHAQAVQLVHVKVRNQPRTCIHLTWSSSVAHAQSQLSKLLELSRLRMLIYIITGRQQPFGSASLSMATCPRPKCGPHKRRVVPITDRICHLICYWIVPACVHLTSSSRSFALQKTTGPGKRSLSGKEFPGLQIERWHDCIRHSSAR